MHFLKKVKTWLNAKNTPKISAVNAYKDSGTIHQLKRVKRKLRQLIKNKEYIEPGPTGQNMSKSGEIGSSKN